jgi:dephospho-CoA kinase
MNKNSLKASNTPLLVGLTGGIGSGKSVAARIWSLLGVPVFNADLTAKSILDQSKEVRSAVSELLGDEVYRDGHADRVLMARKVFGSPATLEKLNAIIHPMVNSYFDTWVKRHHAAPYLLKEAAIIIEQGRSEDYDFVLLVTAPKAERVLRVGERNGWSKDEVVKRMDAQWEDEKKRGFADFEIVNDGKHALLPQVLDLHEKLLKAAGMRQRV